MRIAAVILAAGAAARMGKTKQLLMYQGRTLVEHAIRQAQQAGFSPIVAVVGAESEAVSEAVRQAGVTPELNVNWQGGMGSSIGTGVAAVLKAAPDLDAIAVLLVDQPFVTHEHLAAMCREFEVSGAPILAASYAETLGVPAIFARSVVPVLQALPPSAGARQILRQSGSSVHSYELPEAATDIDTPADLQKLG